MAQGYYSCRFLRIEFICIIWTTQCKDLERMSSWGLNLFVLFEHHSWLLFQCFVLEDWIYLYYLNSSNLYNPTDAVLEDWIYLYYLNEFQIKDTLGRVLEDWIYLYYLNEKELSKSGGRFLRIEFICIIWTDLRKYFVTWGSWGLNLFVLFEPV